MDATSVVLLFFVAVAALVALGVVFGSFFTVETAQVAIVQRLENLRASPARD